MIVKFLIVFLLFFLVTPGLFVKVPIKGNHIVVALIHSIIFALLLWLVCNCLKLKEGLSIKTETEKANKLIDQLKNATTKEAIDNDVAELKSELKRLIAMRNNYLYMGKKHPDHATEFKNDALTLDSVIDKAKTAIADAEANKTTPAKKPVPVPVPAPAKKTVPLPVPAPAKKTVPVPAPAKKVPSPPAQIDLTLSVDCNNVDVAPLKFSSTNLPDDKYTISVSFFYNNQPRNNIIIHSTPKKLEEISASNKYAKDVFTGKENMIPDSVKPIAYFFAPFTCAGKQFPERGTKGPFIFTLTDSTNKKYYFSMTDTQYMTNLSLHANEWQFKNKGTVTLFEEKSIPQLPPAKQIVTPEVPTYPYTPTIPSVSIYNCRGTSETWGNTAFYTAATKKNWLFPKGSVINVCAVYFIFTNNNEFTNFTTNINNSFTKNGTIAFTINNEDQFELINILLPSNKNWEKFLNKNTDNQYTAIGILNTSPSSPQVKNIKSPTIKFELKSNPIPLPVIPAPADNSVKPSTSKTSHQPSTIVPAPAPSPAVSEKKNLTLKARCTSYVSSNSNTSKPPSPPISPLMFSSTNLPNDKYSLTVRFQPGIIGNNGPGGFNSETTVTLVPSSQPQELEKMEITSTYTPNIFTNNPIPTANLNKAIFLTPLACMQGTLQANPFAKGPYIFTLTNTRTNGVYKFQMTDKEYLSLTNSINSSKNLQSLTLTEMEQTKTSSSTAITGSSLVMKASCIGGPTFAKLTFSPGANNSLSSSSKYTLDMIFMNPMHSESTFKSDPNGMIVPIVTTPTPLEKITISTSNNNNNPNLVNDPTAKQLAGFLNIFLCNAAPTFNNNTFVWSKGPFKFRFTEQVTDKTYEYTLTNEDYINLAFDVNGLQEYKANNLTAYPGPMSYKVIPNPTSASITLTN